MPTVPIAWAVIVPQYHALGIWHAVRFLATIGTVKDPAETAHDVVQQAWIKLWRANKFTKGLFVTAVINMAYTEAARTRPIETMRKRGKKQIPFHRPGCECSTCTGAASMFPVQIFGGLIDEVTYDNEIHGSGCGGE